MQTDANGSGSGRNDPCNIRSANGPCNDPKHTRNPDPGADPQAQTDANRPGPGSNGNSYTVMGVSTMARGEYYAITATTREFIQSNYAPGPDNASYKYNLGRSSPPYKIEVWRWRIIGGPYLDYTSALRAGTRRAAGLGLDAANNLKILQEGQLKKYRISV